MTTVAMDLALVFAVGSAWLGCLGFARLKTALDRLHCVAFVNAAVGAGLVLAAFLQEGPTVRAFKLVFLLVATLLTGAAMSHAAGRALALRDGDRR